MKNVEVGKKIYLKDYKPANFKIDAIDLCFNLDKKETIVENIMSITPLDSNDIILLGDELNFIDAKIGDKLLTESDFQISDGNFHLKKYPDSKFQLTLKNTINPLENTALEGLYFADNMFCTQNEPEGFRRITYYLDRPDNMAKFSTKIIADRNECPVLLSNGNLIESGELENGKHFAKWEDPFKKPSYLFALVAGDLGRIEDSYKTKSGRDVKLEIYCDKGNEFKLGFAMESLKNSMKWDEDVYGLEYDLDIYMIVAVDSFNMGAMENKGLNIFNTSCVMADPKSATDHDYHIVEGVIGHEYFHNWTGNRVTCRDWFQLTLKEGLTVFRDQEFSADMSDRMVQRIKDVRDLRMGQFPEDLGPTSHPIRPQTYIQINNFYTATVYNKGAEVIRMIHTILGKTKFRAGMDAYFDSFDEQAVTCEDFIKSMEKGGDRDFTLFRNWYDQKGIPVVEIKTEYDKNSKNLSMNLTQTAHNFAGDSIILEIPLLLSLIEKEAPLNQKSHLLILDEKSKTFNFENINSEPVVSLNQNFTAPIILKNNGTTEDLIYRLAHDKDGFNRWDSMQELVKRKITDHVTNGTELFNDNDIQAFGNVIKDSTIGKALVAELLTLPSLPYLLQSQTPRNIEKTHEALKKWKTQIATEFEKEILNLYVENNLQNEDYKFDKNQVAKRRLKNCALSYLVTLDNEKYLDMAYEQFSQSTNQTDEITALSILANNKNEKYIHALEEFEKKWYEDALVMDKWFSIQSSCYKENTITKVKNLLKHDKFKFNNPNKVRSLIGGFMRNELRFNAKNGAGYTFLAEMIIKLDSVNPSMASGLANGFRAKNKMDDNRKSMIEEQLKDILKIKDLSNNTFEVVSRILEN